MSEVFFHNFFPQIQQNRESYHIRAQLYNKERMNGTKKHYPLF
jgi:hypothetical protein